MAWLYATSKPAKLEIKSCYHYCHLNYNNIDVYNLTHSEGFRSAADDILMLLIPLACHHDNHFLIKNFKITDYTFFPRVIQYDFKIAAIDIYLHGIICIFFGLKFESIT